MSDEDDKVFEDFKNMILESTKPPEKWTKVFAEAVDRVISDMSEEDKKRIKDMKETDMLNFHHVWGTHIRNSLGLWHNKELLDACGSRHPDDASTVIIRAVWQKLQQ